MPVKENQETLVRTKARELCSAMELRGWASTKFVPTPPYGYTLISTTGCRAWFGKRWGMICDDMEDHLKVVLDVPRGKVTEAELSQRTALPITGENEGISSVEIIDNRDRDTIVLYLYVSELKHLEFKNSEIMELVSDVRRWACL
ncbi:hypothetical protein [Salibacterium halotolerans]|uniref:Uncharacterized protein n=1 Tax=Salibacterium halotolerans TaxID=1884432 RepID=A0A1I5QFE8_9BACI|nr:hypothetical protein [Salibacterium halotolerans]SFP44771.1 hypothetical protein SAMN05518683_105131 [Salibacterium halotolerans]